MPTLSVFQTTNFNPNTKPVQSVIVDANGLIDAGPISDPISLGYTAANLESYLEDGFATIGYGDRVNDIDQQFPNATYYFTIAQAVTQNNQTTYFVDHGIKGDAGSDVIFDTSGDDIFNTKGGDDLIVSFSGNNAIATGSGDDVILIGDGNDVVRTGGGHDLIITRQGDDAIKAGGGRDIIEAGAGNDLVLGGGGKDRIDGGADNDVLNGGNGRDTFVFYVGSGSDVIEDFDNTKDRIELDLAMGAASFQDVANASSQSGADLVITLGTDEITLLNTSIADLNGSDFVFV